MASLRGTGALLPGSPQQEVWLLVTICTTCWLAPATADAQRAHSKRSAAHAEFRAAKENFHRGEKLALRAERARKAKKLARAERLSRRAHALFDKALGHYQKAYKLNLNPKSILGMAYCLNRLGRPAAAARTLLTFIHLSRTDQRIPKELVVVARKLLSQVHESASRIQLRCRPADVELVLNSEQVDTPLEWPIYLPPGWYTIELSRPGYRPFSTTLSLAVGEHRELKVVLHREPAVAAGPTSQPASRPASAANPYGIGAAPPLHPLLPRARDRAPTDAPSTKTIVGYSLLGLGLALTAGSGVLYVAGGVQGSMAQDKYRSLTSEKPAPSKVSLDNNAADKEAARNKVLAANILLGAAAVAVGTSLYILLTRKKAGTSAPALSASVHATPAGAVIGVVSTF